MVRNVMCAVALCFLHFSYFPVYVHSAPFFVVSQCFLLSPMSVVQLVFSAVFPKAADEREELEDEAENDEVGRMNRLQGYEAAIGAALGVAPRAVRVEDVRFLYHGVALRTAVRVPRALFGRPVEFAVVIARALRDRGLPEPVKPVEPLYQVGGVLIPTGARGVFVVGWSRKQETRRRYRLCTGAIVFDDDSVPEEDRTRTAITTTGGDLLLRAPHRSDDEPLPSKRARYELAEGV